jgi:hypothetical protein|tara:strand:- start:160 stop:396 length:237 start_codon:yes stop_codon:yes gene_type:complete
MTLINDKGYYTGPEMRWNVEDVKMACERIGLTLTESDYERVLIAAIEDNEWLMGQIQEAILCAIEYMINQGELPKPTE